MRTSYFGLVLLTTTPRFTAPGPQAGKEVAELLVECPSRGVASRLLRRRRAKANNIIKYQAESIKQRAAAATLHFAGRALKQLLVTRVRQTNADQLYPSPMDFQKQNCAYHIALYTSFKSSRKVRVGGQFLRLARLRVVGQFVKHHKDAIRTGNGPAKRTCRGTDCTDRVISRLMPSHTALQPILAN